MTEFISKPAARVKQMTFKQWLQTLAAAAIVGAAQTVLQFFGMSGAHTFDAKVAQLSLHDLWVMMTIAAATHVATILMKSPIPNYVSEEETTVTSTVKTTTISDLPTTPEPHKGNQ